MSSEQEETAFNPTTKLPFKHVYLVIAEDTTIKELQQSYDLLIENNYISKEETEAIHCLPSTPKDLKGNTWAKSLPKFIKKNFLSARGFYAAHGYIDGNMASRLYDDTRMAIGHAANNNAAVVVLGSLDTAREGHRTNVELELAEHFYLPLAWTEGNFAHVEAYSYTSPSEEDIVETLGLAPTDNEDDNLEDTPS